VTDSYNIAFITTGFARLIRYRHLFYPDAVEIESLGRINDFPLRSLYECAKDIQDEGSRYKVKGSRKEISLS
jgi:hypothetical protein